MATRSWRTTLALVWAGMLIGVSFIATPVKFEAPSLALGPALDVGRHTFALFTKLEWLMLSLILLANTCRRASASQTAKGLVPWLLLGILLAQTFWLLPMLDLRVSAVLAGIPKPASFHHATYAGLEVLKLLLLAVLGLEDRINQ